MKNAEWLIKKHIPFDDVIATYLLNDVIAFRYDGDPIGCIDCVKDNVIATNDGIMLYAAYIKWLGLEHEYLTPVEKRVLINALSDLGRLNDSNTTVRWYCSNAIRDNDLNGPAHMIQIEDAWHNPLWTMCLKDTGYKFDGMLQDQRYSLKELGLMNVEVDQS